MRVISANLNGIRAAARKGFFEWMLEQDADFVCVQETKAQMAILEGDIFRPAGYTVAFSDAEKKGYSGVGIYAKKKPQKIISSFGWPDADKEGRFIQFDYDDLSVVSIYFPSGSSGDVRQAVKYEFMEQYLRQLKQLIQQSRSVIICGDWNIVHKEIDIKNFKSNQRSSGCLPQERAWLDDLIAEIGWVDAFRVINQEPHQYTWWSNRGQAWANNVGWRIDYQMVTPDLKSRVSKVSIYKDQRFSDHAPLTVDYRLPIE